MEGGGIMKELDIQKTALTFGVFLGGWHLVWSILILVGVAQMLLDFVFWMHMITPVYQVTGFNLTQSATLIVVTFILGYAGGWIFAWIWNKMHGK
ncbi:MAG: hypothetical protein ACHQT7_00275 [Candidatus Levyibacteriota bacterium]